VRDESTTLLEMTSPGALVPARSAPEPVVLVVELEAERDGNAGVVVFGLVPEFVGKGYGRRVPHARDTARVEPRRA
jgi:hypothetical protein